MGSYKVNSTVVEFILHGFEKKFSPNIILHTIGVRSYSQLFCNVKIQFQTTRIILVT